MREKKEEKGSRLKMRLVGWLTWPWHGNYSRAAFIDAPPPLPPPPPIDTISRGRHLAERAIRRLMLYRSDASMAKVATDERDSFVCPAVCSCTGEPEPADPR